MKNHPWIISALIVIISAGMLAAWYTTGMGSADSSIVTLGAIGWLALTLGIFGSLALVDSKAHRA